jgi:DNA-binding NarL/FixJ family response regulator
MDTRHRARLVIADDHTLVAEAFRRLLEPEFDVVAVVNNGRALLEVGAELKPDVALVDIAMPRLNGLDASEELKRLVPFTKVVILTMSLDAQLAAEAFRRGASAYVVKNAAVDELLTAIREVLKGQSFLSPLITEDTVHVLLRNGNRSDSDKRITARQREVLQLVAEGMSMKEIANALNVKPGTVAFHKYRAMENLGLKTNSDLLRYAIAHHMIS